MAVAAGLGFSASALSGLALGMSCSWEIFESVTGKKREEKEPEVEAAPAAAASKNAAPMTWEGFSMEESRLHADTEQSRSMARSANEVLSDLQRGNTRFWTGTAVRPEASAFERRALVSKQFPSVAILGCSDSRVPTEIIFDQGLGDLFVIRVAGNALDLATKASLQYAVHHLRVKVVVILGHELCGAVKAAQLPMEVIKTEPTQLEQALTLIKGGLNENGLSMLSDPRALDREAVTTNVKKQVESLTFDNGIMSKVRSKEVIMVGAFYEISSGIVDFFHEVSGDERGAKFSREPSVGVQTRYVPIPLK